MGKTGDKSLAEAQQFQCRFNMGVWVFLIGWGRNLARLSAQQSEKATPRCPLQQ